jgi:hypothetical protein
MTKYQMKSRAAAKPKQTAKPRPYCFVSYSSRETHVNVLFPCLHIAFGSHFNLRLTPSALESGASQYQQIVELIQGCAFAVVVLDGLRPNVTFEYGLLEARNIPVILLKEKNAIVDIASLLVTPGTLPGAVPLSLDLHFSDVKDINYATWSRDNPAEAIRLLVKEYKKKKAKLPTLPNLSEQSLWDIT